MQYEKPKTLSQLEEENAKLWELVRDMYKFMSIAEELNAHIKLAPSETCSFANRMRELGIEVADAGGGRMSKEHAYAYEAGYRDGSVNYELEHCPACKNVADLQEALVENAKLRELVRHLYEYRQSYFETGIYPTDHGVTERYMRELGIEVE